MSRTLDANSTNVLQGNLGYTVVPCGLWFVFYFYFGRAGRLPHARWEGRP